ncbi:MAG: rod shape-determining protein [Candidatus Yanofskybacteria bacterium RIFOXYD1_FULL_44_17]|uniref:Cell shape-determining protein MreB n=1 Tax=Candidatus Yanofskybacteria bacterium GW2011_GWE2_40_11 TaxID=1619033 RepID=A0A0G0T269_9BACT|nr:MAG: Rod shape-determining protein mreB [Candidatus Yanofskybacteria bacterium GW2011_GWE2_40_11]OGN36211.1 MAG: rod shape-determining protein [Candidatus Yanofskybacteria bacterium RIFOXYA2_FULL_45_28]OGN36927.1 MAG: rod shape-determining protein [Candidatus Yanofskybacteria bacterium RIFOXYA1_FULL_44_17]OGN38370.1 MAG: rod shape-determining protein [Candidatus Yanofskybacteria bacterium RIFOXYC1_FULL_44_16]OGN38548.1 MAG: rod shape-determining protein [Candidatus Yanofskybacteria bacterium
MKKIGIDLGTTNTVVFLPKKGIVINEPSVVAISVLDNKVIAVGNLAKEMIGRTPDSIIVSKPLVDGAIADYRITTAMLRYFIKKAGGFMNFVKPEVLISVPAGITSTEKRAVIESALNAGAKAVYLVKEPVLAAIGAKIPINNPSGNMILNIGGGTTELAVISLGGIVSCSSVRVAGNKLDAAIVEFIKKKHGLAIGERTAELIKINIGSAAKQAVEEKINIKGRDLATGYPKTVELSSNEITDAMSEQLREIIQIIKSVLEVTPPELCSDIMDRGIIVSGGGALLKNISTLITRVTGVPASIADDPLFCVARGTGIVLENLDVYKRNVIAKR